MVEESRIHDYRFHFHSTKEVPMKLFTVFAVLLAFVTLSGCKSPTTGTSTTQPTAISSSSVFDTVKSIASQVEAVANLLVASGDLKAADVTPAIQGLNDALDIWQSTLNPAPGQATELPRKAESRVHDKISSLEKLISDAKAK